MNEIANFEHANGDDRWKFINQEELQRLGQEYFGDVTKSWKPIHCKRKYNGKVNHASGEVFKEQKEYDKYIELYQMAVYDVIFVKAINKDIPKVYDI